MPSKIDFVEAVMIAQSHLNIPLRNRNMGELAAFISYAQAFPKGFLALIDTYDTVLSGIENFICVGAALHAFGYQPLGVRLDSGDLNYLSHACRKRMTEADEALSASIFCKCQIVASDDLDESKLLSLKTSAIDTYGIGTNLVTCSVQPALGCVYKLVELSGKPCIKLSNNVTKMVIPFRKEVYRLYGSDGHPVIDLMMLATDSAPVVGKPVMCKHPYEDKKRVKCTPAKVEILLRLVWDGSQGGILVDEPPLLQTKSFVKSQIDQIRNDHKQANNPVPYKVSVSEGLYDRLHKLWEDSSPLLELS
jgi:nicotinate phosphoribosyltransferase